MEGLKASVTSGRPNGTAQAGMATMTSDTQDGSRDPDALHHWPFCGLWAWRT
jgi:hypothetical protein